MAIDISQLETLLGAGKLDEARAIIQAAVNEKMTDEEKGSALATIAEVYVDIQNTINAEHLEALKEAIAGLKIIDAAEDKAKDQEELAKVRGELGK
jgi:hypothetical protein